MIYQMSKFFKRILSLFHPEMIPETFIFLLKIEKNQVY